MEYLGMGIEFINSLHCSSHRNSALDSSLVNENSMAGARPVVPVTYRTGHGTVDLQCLPVLPA